MRVISGSLGGRRLRAPPGRATRPMLDAQKESLFNILRADLCCAGVLDLFAGSGGLGIEALSRGVPRATFVEQARQARVVLGRNLMDLDLEERSEVLGRDALQLDPSRLQHALGLVFCDPPFPLVSQKPRAVQALLERLATSGVLEDTAVLVLRLPRDAALQVAPEGLRLADEREMGHSRILILRPGRDS